MSYETNGFGERRCNLSMKKVNKEISDNTSKYIFKILLGDFS